jgi:acetyl-CoA carboxylase biotin carboxylase subunit
MVGKLIVYGKDRQQALARCRRALDEFIVEGVHTTIPFAHHIVSNPDFAAGKYNTGFIDKLMQEGF